MSKKKHKSTTSDSEHLFPRSPCPITATLDLLGDKWTLILIRDLFLGKRTYGDFQSSPEGIPTNILAERLKRLLEHGIITKEAYQDKPVRFAYLLTKKGDALAPMVEEVAKWGLKYIKGTEAKLAKK
ncbi:MAG: helix-turn-helix domain-containing protein [Gammaproteobacteria bacterium]|nr:MAG: helix-turn-helix domain-containing protein [Gammaproteobacteria bacterium]